MSVEEEDNCVFGEEYGRCPVIPKIIEMRQDAIQAMKGVYGDRAKFLTNTMTTVMSTPILNLSQYCQACPKVIFTELGKLIELLKNLI